MEEKVQFQVENLLNYERARALLLGVIGAISSGVEGDVAEFGTMSGFTADVLAKGLAHCRKRYGKPDELNGYPPRNLWLFDSFEGLPSAESESDKASPHVKAGVWKRGTCRGLNAHQLQTLVSKTYPLRNVQVVEGWYDQTITQLGQTKLAVLHIDCDLYDSTIVVLDYVFSNNLMTDGSTIFFDDWGSNRFSADFGEQKAWAEIVEKYKVKYTDYGNYSAGGKQFIIHI
jgi:hypothetical protein